MTDAPEANAAGFDEPTPEETTDGGPLTPMDESTPDLAEVGRTQTFADIAVAVSFALKVGWFMVASRGWFYVADDWDYLTRRGFDQVFEPHTDHLTAIVSAYAIAIRPLVGFDYWPGYAILAAVSWPIVGVAAYWVWRRRRLNPVVSACAAIFLMWMGTAGWVQYGHAGAGFGIAATIVAIEIDQRRPSARSVSLSFLLTVVATVASTSGAIGTVGRLIAALLRRKWTGVAATAPVVAGYLWYRAYHGSTADPVFDPGDVFAGLGTAFQLIGDGMLLVVPWPSSLAWVLGLGMIAAAVASLLASRFSYTSLSIVALGAGYLASVVVYRYLSRSVRLVALEENGLDLGVPAAPRYAMVFTVVVIVAVVPLIAGWFTTRSRILALIVCTALLVGLGVYHTAGRHTLIEDRSLIVASRLESTVALMEQGEPVVTEGSRIDPVVGKALTFEQLQWILHEGLDQSMLNSDIYRTADVPSNPAEAARGRMRLSVWPKGKLEGTWSDVGIESRTRCIPLEGVTSFQVAAPVRYRLEVPVRDFYLVLTWMDQYGMGTVIAADHPSEINGIVVANETTWKGDRAVVHVKTAAPDTNGPLPIMTIEARNDAGPIDASMCLNKSPRAPARRSP